MDLKNDHNVYILGAGFSREAGLPLISDFLVRMRDSHEWLRANGRKDEADEVQRVLEFRLKAASAAYYVNLDLENIEELFSLASASEGDMDRSIRIGIAATLDFVRQTSPLEQCEMCVTDSTRSAKLFVAPTAKGDPGRYPTWAKPVGDLDRLNLGRVGPFRITRYAFYVARLLGLFWNGALKGENTFITFNYDTVLEDTLDELGIRFRYAFGPSKVKSPETAESEVSTIPVLKLHGSVNWGEKHATGQSRSPLKIYKSWPNMRADNAEYVLVPPTWKKILGGALEAVWDAAVRNLESATRIVIIGFSIPPTDMHFKYLLAAGLQNNVSLRQILFVDPDANDQLKARAETLLRKSYIESRLIDFAKVDFSAFTGFHLPHLDKIGRPAEYGLNCQLHTV